MEIGFNLNLLDPQYSYSFVLQHPENRIVVPFDLAKIFLGEIYYKNGLDMIPQNIYLDQFKILEKYFKFPAILPNNFKTWDEIKFAFKNCDYKE